MMLVKMFFPIFFFFFSTCQMCRAEALNATIRCHGPWKGGPVSGWVFTKSSLVTKSDGVVGGVVAGRPDWQPRCDADCKRLSRYCGNFGRQPQFKKTPKNAAAETRRTHWKEIGNVFTRGARFGVNPASDEQLIWRVDATVMCGCVSYCTPVQPDSAKESIKLWKPIPQFIFGRSWLNCVLCFGSVTCSWVLKTFNKRIFKGEENHFLVSLCVVLHRYLLKLTHTPATLVLW